MQCCSALWCPGGKSLVFLVHQGEQSGVCGHPEQADMEKVPILVLALPATGRVLWARRRKCPSLLIRKMGAGFADRREEVDGWTFGAASRSQIYEFLLGRVSPRARHFPEAEDDGSFTRVLLASAKHITV